jgi:threonine aldolase
VGSALCGPAEKIKLARRKRKMLGGGMRQIGSLAAAALYALERHIDRLAEDHEKAQLIADGVRESQGLKLIADEVDTNIVIFTVHKKVGTSAEFCDKLRQKGIRMNPNGPQRVRAVTHLDVSIDQCREVADVLRKY